MRTFLLPVLLLTAGSAPAALWTASDNTVSVILDGRSSGLARSLPINTAGELVLSVEVELSLSATPGGTAFLGDLYVYLTNGTDLAVLVNRPGRRDGVPAGYSDNQSMNVTFSSVPGTDFHNYRLTATGSNVIALNGPVIGIWEADGRATDPATVLDTDQRTAGLNVFQNTPADGTWSLFAADLSSGGTHQINSWSLAINTIPEPGSSTLAILTLAALGRRRRKC